MLLGISIHAPRAGSDNVAFKNAANTVNFNPRSPCGERRQKRNLSAALKVFQSTLPVRGATTNFGGFRDKINISIHAPRAGSDFFLTSSNCSLSISIHAPRAGSDKLKDGIIDASENFNPRSPCGERRNLCNIIFLKKGISIHAPRAGSDGH